MEGLLKHPKPNVEIREEEGKGQRKRMDQKGQLRHGIQNKCCVPVQGEELLGRSIPSTTRGAWSLMLRRARAGYAWMPPGAFPALGGC